MKENNKLNALPDKDILGQEKTGKGASTGKAHPLRIFALIAILIVIALVYWLAKSR